MKYLILSIVIISISLISCQKQNDNGMDNVNISKVQFLQPGPCCSNMELIDQEPIFSDLVGYSETILFAVNIDEFSSLEIQHNDSLAIEYIFSSEEVSCVNICNRHSGIPIELISVEKI